MKRVTSLFVPAGGFQHRHQHRHAPFHGVERLVVDPVRLADLLALQAFGRERDPVLFGKRDFVAGLPRPRELHGLARHHAQQFFKIFGLGDVLQAGGERLGEVHAHQLVLLGAKAEVQAADVHLVVALGQREIAREARRALVLGVDVVDDLAVIVGLDGVQVLDLRLAVFAEQLLKPGVDRSHSLLEGPVDPLVDDRHVVSD